jgi:hypothetical protein
MDMDKWLPTLLCFCVFAASAEMYKWEDADGNIHYTDQPPTEQAEKLSLPPINSYTPPEQRVEEQDMAEILPDEAPDLENIVYEKLTITSPKMNETIRNSDGTVPVAYTLTPGGALKQGHQYQLMLDGRVEKGATSTLSNVDRGSHTIKVQIVNAAGVIQISSQAVIFHLHREADGKETTDSTTPDDNTEAYTPGSDDADHSAEDDDGIVQDPDGSSYDPTNITDPDDERDSVFDPTTSGHGAGTSYDPENSGYGSGTSPSPGTFNAPSGTYTPNYNQKR